MSKVTVNNLEIKVVNYLIYKAIQKAEFSEIDWESLIKTAGLRGRLELWKNIYGSIKAQLSLNPNDIDGFSIVPIWVRKIYQQYRQTDLHDMWNPDGLNFESLPNMQKDIFEVNENSRLAYSDKHGSLHLLPFKTSNVSKEYFAGYLLGVGAEKLFRIKLEPVVGNDYEF